MPDHLATLSLTQALAAYLLPCITSALAAWAAWQGFRRLREDALRDMAAAFAVVAGIQGALLAVASVWQAAPGSLLRALDCCSAVAIGWVLLDRARRAFLVSALSMCGVLSAFMLSLWQLTGQEPAGGAATWSLVSAVIYGGATVSLWAKRRERPWTLLAALALLTLGSLLGAGGLADGMLALRLVAFPLAPVALMQFSTRELQSARLELESFSEHSLRQTQQLLMLLRTSAELVNHFDMAALLRQAAEGVALGISADSALIALLEDAPERAMHVQAIYPPTLLPCEIVFKLSSQPAIAGAVQHSQQVALASSQRGVHALAALMGGEAGPAIVQPMLCQERALGVIVALNHRSQRAFTQDEQRVLEALGAQIAAVAENALLYKRLDTQARELARLLAVRQEETDRQAAILASIADGIIVTDHQDQIVLANAEATKIMGLAPEKLVGQPFGSILGQVIPTGSGAATGRGALRAVFQVGPRVIQSSLAPVQDPSGQHLGWVAVLRDVTAERAAEQAKTEFIYTISHELRTPLTFVKGYADLLMAGAGGEMSAVQRQYAETIHSGAERLTTVVNAVIQFSEMEQGLVEIHAQPMDVGAIIAQVADSTHPKVEARGLSLKTDIATNLPLAHADPSRTQQIIEQLLDNAMRFTSSGGQLSVRAIPSWDGMNTEQPSHVAITVTDTGVGLTCPDHERVFERFYRAPNPMQVSAGGLGIGLAIARALAQAQGGRLWVESPGATDTRPGQGCKFTLLLPAARTTVAAPETAGSTPWLEEALSFLEDGN